MYSKIYPRGLFDGSASKTASMTVLNVTKHIILKKKIEKKERDGYICLVKRHTAVKLMYMYI